MTAPGAVSPNQASAGTRDDEWLEPGDIVNVDVTTCLHGFHGDTSATFLVGTPSPEARHVVEVARRCRDAGVALVREGFAWETSDPDRGGPTREGCSVVREFGGHGIGRRMHMDPHVPHFGRSGTGLRLRAGMCLTVEPMVNLGGAAVRVLDDGWTVVTADASLSPVSTRSRDVLGQGLLPGRRRRPTSHHRAPTRSHPRHSVTVRLTWPP